MCHVLKNRFTNTLSHLHLHTQRDRSRTEPYRRTIEMCVCNSVFYRHRVFLLLFISFLSLSLLLQLRRRRVFFHSFHSLFQVVEAFCYLYSDSAIQCWLQIKSLYELRNRVFCALHTLVVVRRRRRRCCLA